MTTRKFLGVVFRLSVAVGLCFGLLDAYQTFSDWDTSKAGYSSDRMRMVCASKINDDWLVRNTNSMGTIDVSPVCGPGSDGKTFYTNKAEIDQTRSGVDIYAGLNWRRPYDLPKSLFTSAIAFAVVNFLGISVLVIFFIGRWIVFGANRSRS